MTEIQVQKQVWIVVRIISPLREMISMKTEVDKNSINKDNEFTINYRIKPIFHWGLIFGTL